METKVKEKIRKVRAYKQLDGYARNPILRMCRNVSCLCGSMKKAKKCCGRAMYIKTENAEKIQNFIDKLSSEAITAIGYK